MAFLRVDTFCFVRISYLIPFALSADHTSAAACASVSTNSIALLNAVIIIHALLLFCHEEAVQIFSVPRVAPNIIPHAGTKKCAIYLSEGAVLTTYVSHSSNMGPEKTDRSCVFQVRTAFDLSCFCISGGNYVTISDGFCFIRLHAMKRHLIVFLLAFAR